jgi:UDP-N-acetylmuramate dehydrogenase
MGNIKIEETRMIAGAGARLSKAVETAVEHGLSGLQGCAGVPGTIGGAVVMNAGTRYGWIGDITKRVTVVNEDGTVQDLTNSDLDFRYKHSVLQGRDRIIVEAEFELQPGSSEELASFVSRILRRRNMTQPTNGRSAGCMFKNPDDMHAGELIEKAGAKGMREGDAEVSEKHANFFMNMGHANAAQMRSLSERAREMVRDKLGITLEYEVQMIGDWK